MSDGRTDGRSVGRSAEPENSATPLQLIKKRNPRSLARSLALLSLSIQVSSVAYKNGSRWQNAAGRQAGRPSSYSCPLLASQICALDLSLLTVSPLLSSPTVAAASSSDLNGSQYGRKEGRKEGRMARETTAAVGSIGRREFLPPGCAGRRLPSYERTLRDQKKTKEAGDGIGRAREETIGARNEGENQECEEMEFSSSQLCIHC